MHNFYDIRPKLLKRSEQTGCLKLCLITFTTLSSLFISSDHKNALCLFLARYRRQSVLRQRTQTEVSEDSQKFSHLLVNIAPSSMGDLLDFRSAASVRREK